MKCVSECVCVLEFRMHAMLFSIIVICIWDCSHWADYLLAYVCVRAYGYNGNTAIHSVRKVVNVCERNQKKWKKAEKKERAREMKKNIEMGRGRCAESDRNLSCHHTNAAASTILYTQINVYSTCIHNESRKKSYPNAYLLTFCSLYEIRAK